MVCQFLEVYEKCFWSWLILFLFSFTYFCSFLNLFFSLIFHDHRIIFFRFKFILLSDEISFAQELSFFIHLKFLFYRENSLISFLILYVYFQYLFFSFILNLTFYFKYLFDIYLFLIRSLFPSASIFLAPPKVITSDFQLLFKLALNHIFTFFVFLRFIILFY